MLLLFIRRYLLAMLETTVGGCAILCVVILLFPTIVALRSILLLRRIGGLLLITTVVTLLGRIRALVLGRVLLVALVVLIVRARHDDSGYGEAVGRDGRVEQGRLTLCRICADEGLMVGQAHCGRRNGRLL